jgi:hypothetical protein
MRSNGPLRCLTTVIVALALMGPARADAQVPVAARTFETARTVSIGYVANAPNAFLGAGIAFINPTFVGAFADFRTSGSSPAGRSNFVPEWDVDRALNEFGDFFFNREDDWMVVNAGLTRVIGPELAIYAGAGYARLRAFEQYEDPEGERGEFGYYWVEDDRVSGNYVNALGGVYFRAGRNLVFQFGAESRPRGMTVGVHYALPIGR